MPDFLSRLLVLHFVALLTLAADAAIGPEVPFTSSSEPVAAGQTQDSPVVSSGENHTLVGWLNRRQSFGNELRVARVAGSGEILDELGLSVAQDVAHFALADSLAVWRDVEGRLFAVIIPSEGPAARPHMFRAADDDPAPALHAARRGELYLVVAGREGYLLDVEGEVVRGPFEVAEAGSSVVALSAGIEGFTLIVTGAIDGCAKCTWRIELSSSGGVREAVELLPHPADDASIGAGLILVIHRSVDGVSGTIFDLEGDNAPSPVDLPGSTWTARVFGAPDGLLLVAWTAAGAEIVAIGPDGDRMAFHSSLPIAAWPHRFAAGSIGERLLMISALPNVEPYGSGGDEADLIATIRDETGAETAPFTFARSAKRQLAADGDVRAGRTAIAWQEVTSALEREIRVDAPGGGALTIATTEGALPDQRRIAISAGTAWDLVVWEEPRIGGQRFLAARVSSDRSRIDGPVVLDSSGLRPSIGTPVVAWGEGHFMVAWNGGQHPHFNFPDTSVIRVAVIAEEAPLADAIVSELTAPGRIQVDPTIAFDGSAFVLAWEDWRSRTCGNLFCSGEVEIRAMRLDTSGLPIGPDTLISSELIPPQTGPAIACGVAGCLVQYTDRSTDQPISLAVPLGPDGASGPALEVPPCDDLSAVGGHYLCTYAAGEWYSSRWNVFGAWISPVSGSDEAFAIAASADAEINPFVVHDSTRPGLRVFYQRIATEDPYGGVERLFSRSIGAQRSRPARHSSEGRTRVSW